MQLANFGKKSVCVRLSDWDHFFKMRSVYEIFFRPEISVSHE